MTNSPKQCCEAFEKWFSDDGAVCSKSAAWKTWQAAWDAKPKVSLEKCALAYCSSDADFEPKAYLKSTPTYRSITNTKAVLKAAGADYVE